MKKILLIAGIMIIGMLLNNSHSQCTFSNPGVKLNGTPYTDPSTGKCLINIDLYFDLESNPGGKYVFVHIWAGSDYPNYGYGAPPTTTNGVLIKSIATVGFYHHTTNLYMLSLYPPESNLQTFQYTGLKITKGPSALPGYDRFSISGITIASLQDCSIPQSFFADAWESQSADAQNVHCFSKGLEFYANDPAVNGLMFCQIPRTYRFNISTINTAGIFVNYKVVIDNGDRVYNKIDDNIQVNSGSVTIDANNGYKFSSGILGYLPYSNQKPYCDYSLWIIITSPSIPNEIYGRIDNLCIPLAENLFSFNAERKNETVWLSWTTLSEKNNKGFYIERKELNGDWQVKGFIASRAQNGNSDDMLKYVFADNNNLQGISQYRLCRVDLNNEKTYSEVRLIKGLDAVTTVLIFPNPSKRDDYINIVMNNTGAEKTVKLIDMNGRVIKQWLLTGKDQITPGNIPPGIYTLQILIKATNELINKKLVVK